MHVRYPAATAAKARRALMRSATVAAVLLVAAGCATPPNTKPGKLAKAWRIEPVFNVGHAMQSSQAYYTMGRYHDGSQAWDKSIEAYRKAIALDAGNLEAYNALGVALARHGRHADAETTLRQAVALNPALTHVRSNLGYVLLLAGKPQQAVAELEAAVEQDTSHANAAINLREARVRVAVAARAAIMAVAPGPAADRAAPSPSPSLPPSPATGGTAPDAAAATAPRLDAESAASAALPALRNAGAAERALRLEISNGNGAAGMAARVGRWLTAQGLDSTSLTNTRPYVQQTTLVQYRSGHEEDARRVARALPVAAEAAPGPVQGLHSDVRVLLGRDWLRSAACLARDTCPPPATPVALAAPR